MSRGLGRWQRAILDELERRAQFFLRELLPEYPTKVGYWASRERWVWEERPLPRPSETAALQRAAHRLAAQGRIAIDTARYWTNHRQWTGKDYLLLGTVIVARPGVTINRIQLRLAYEQATEAERRRRWLQPREEASLSVVNTVFTTLNAEPKEAVTPLMSPALRGAVAGLIKLLAHEGAITEALVVERGQALLRWPPGRIEMVLMDLKASGDYQRIIAEAHR